MKHKFLEMGGTVNEKEFYKKYPTEDAFFDAFPYADFGGEELLQAASGIHINPANKGKFNATKQKTGKSTKELTHSKNPITKKRAIFAQNAAKWNKAQGGLNVPKQEDFPDYESFQSAMDAYLYSSGLSNNDQPQQQSRRINFGTIPKQDLPQLENIDQTLSNTSINTNKGPNVPVGEASGLSKAMPYINAGMDVIKGIQQLAAEKKVVKKEKTWAGVTGAQALASQTREQPINRKYFRPEDMIFQPEQLNVPYGAGTNYLAQYGTSIPKAQSGSSMIGKGIGTAAGTAIFGPVGGMVGGWVGGTIGELVDPNAAKIEAYEEQQTNNLNTVMGQNFAEGIHNQYSAFMERGGNIPSEMESNGELRTYGRGNISPISYNPFLPDGGETVMFRGPSHAEGGMPITYGQNPVEVEGGEPALKLSDGGQMGGDNLVVFGDLTIPKGMLDDVNAKGNFKTYITFLSKKENIYNKLSEKASEGMNGLSVYSPYDKLKENSFKMNWEGANAKLKDIAEKKENAGFLQEAINSTAKEGGLDANSLSRGIIKPEKAMSTAQYGGMFGKELVKAQDGKYISKYGLVPFKGNKGTGKYATKYSAKQWDALADKLRFKGKGNAEFMDFLQKNPETKKTVTENHRRLYKKDPFVDNLLGEGHDVLIDGMGDNVKIPIDVPFNGAPYDIFPTTPPPTTIPTTTPPIPANKRSWWMDTFNQVLPYLRPTDTEELDPRQLMGEMFALSNNQLEPVQAQTYQPQLQSPYDISLQEIMNQNQADFNATQRLVGDNPAALAALSSQKYGANEKVLGEQFRLNQANKANVYADNIKTLNDAQLKNLAIYDEQFVRQEKAKSITKETTLAAFSDISDKYSKNKLRNRELATYQNLYNYRYDPRFTAMNMNPLQQWNTELGFPSQQGGLGTPPTGYEWEYILRKLKDKDGARNGAIVKALKLI